MSAAAAHLAFAFVSPHFSHPPVGEQACKGTSTALSRLGTRLSSAQRVHRHEWVEAICVRRVGLKDQSDLAETLRRFRTIQTAYIETECITYVIVAVSPPLLSTLVDILSMAKRLSVVTERACIKSQFLPGKPQPAANFNWEEAYRFKAPTPVSELPSVRNRASCIARCRK